MILDGIIDKYISENKNFCYLTKISNEFLSEYVSINDNIVLPLTNFNGDSAYFYFDYEKKVLLVDGRFTIQAKKETKNIKIVTINYDYSIFSFLIENVVNNKELYLDYRLFSAQFVLSLEVLLNKKIHFNSEIVDDTKIIIYQNNTDYINKQKNRKLYFNNLFNKSIINNNIRLLGLVENEIYITSNLIEIAYITNLRLFPCEINDSLLFGSFLVISNNKIYLYTDYELKNNNLLFCIRKIDNFYKDIKDIKHNFNIDKNIKVKIDYENNNYQIINCLKENTDISINDIQLSNHMYNLMTIKSNKTINKFIHFNIIDSVTLIKFIYGLKHFNFDKCEFTEYNLKRVLDYLRSKNKNFLSTSFDTIVAYKENSAICHYSPNINNFKVVKNKSVLLIDSGANYRGATTDITRTISLYKNKNDIPKKIKYYYTIVLKSLLSLTYQVFLQGMAGSQIDIISRQYLLNKYLNYAHGTGHGIGNNTSVHFGSNNISSSFTSNRNSILKINQVQSIEPGIYFENEFGIRLENDTYVKLAKKNKFGIFLKFESLTLCPFDYDLIDFDNLEKVDIERLNNYNKLVYKKLNKYLKGDLLRYLKDNTKIIKVKENRIYE